jgi:four helix bundle protein
MSKVNFKDLVVWQRAVDLVPKLYRLLRQFPPEENYALSSQIRRAAVSVPANIAEGQSRQSPKEFLYFLSLAKGSLNELQTLLIIAQRLDYIRPDQLEDAEREISEVAKPLHGLARSLQP